MSTDTQTWMMVNASSGSNSAEAVAEVRDALAGAQWHTNRIIDVQSEGCPAIDALRTGGVNRLVIFTGDGTINAMLTILEGWEGEVLVLPGGTANLLARALHGDGEAAEIAARAGAMTVSRRNCIRSANGSAYIELLAGPGAKWSDVREEMRDGSVATIADTAFDAARESAAGAMVRVIEPVLGREEGYAGLRLEPQSAGMLVSGYGAQGLSDYLLQGLALLRRNFREGPHDELGHHSAISCASIGESPIELMIDGERRTGAPREVFSLAPLDVNLLSSAHV